MNEFERRIQEFIDRASPEQRRVLADFRARQENHLRRQLEWVRQLGALAKEIVALGADADWRTRELFWIRLFGVVDELGGGYAERVRMCGTEPPTEGTLHWWLVNLHDAAASILSRLSESETIVIDWLRQRSAHVNQRGFGLQMKKDKTTVKEQRFVAALGRSFTIDELDAARENVLRQYGGDEVAMQVALTKKMQAAINTFVLVHDMSLGQ